MDHARKGPGLLEEGKMAAFEESDESRGRQPPPELELVFGPHDAIALPVDDQGGEPYMRQSGGQVVRLQVERDGTVHERAEADVVEEPPPLLLRRRPVEV